MEFITRLREEATRTNERRLVVVAGDEQLTRQWARDMLAATDIDPGASTYVGSGTGFHCQSIRHTQVDTLLGTSREAIVYDCHDRCEPTGLGQCTGAVLGGGLLVLLTPPIAQWPDYRDEFDRSLAVPPFDLSAVGTTFRRHLIRTLRTHRGIAIVDVDTDTVERTGLSHPPPRLPEQPLEVPVDHEFPSPAYGACKTADQIDAVRTFERLRGGDQAVVVEADRGRGKSSAAGLAAASLAIDGQDILVTAPDPESVGALFDRARELFAALDEPVEESQSRCLETREGRLRYEPPPRATALPEAPDTVFVDEAAALPVRLLSDLLEARSLAFITTVRGYEGTGRGFSVRFKDQLSDSRFTVTERTLSTPIRYAAGDPIEVWLFHTLALTATPAADSLVETTRPAQTEYRQLQSDELLADWRLLRELFGLLVSAHYRTEPNDLARLLDAPNVSVHALTKNDHIVAVALLSREGDLPETLRTAVYEGERIRGNLIPDVLTSQLRDEQAGNLSGVRVMRIATHPAVRSRGLGSQLLDRIETTAGEQAVDWLGVAYGVTPDLVDFWTANGYRTVHLSTTRNDRSGEHSVVMLRPLSPAGTELHDRHSEWFLRRTPDTLRESLSNVEPDVIAAACGGAAGQPTLDLTTQEWRHVAGVPYGTAIYATAPRAVRRLVFRYLVAGDGEILSPSDERLVVRKALQGHSWERITASEQFQTEASCKRRFGTAVEGLLEAYGPESALAELERFR